MATKKKKSVKRNKDIIEYEGDTFVINGIVNSVLAAGRGASSQKIDMSSNKNLEKILSELVELINTVPTEKKEEALEKVQSLKEEVAKGENASDSTMAKLIDGIVALVPGAVSTVVSMFASPILAGFVGPVTRFVLDQASKAMK